MELNGILTYNAPSNVEKHSQPAGTWVVEGYASTSDLDSQNDIVTKDAMQMGADSLLKFGTVLYNHDMDRPIGKVMGAEVTDGGLLVKVAISKTEPKIWEQVKDGTLSKFSIRGRVLEYELQKKSEFSEEQIRVIKAMEIVEVSLVSVPANPNAKTLAYYIEKYLKIDMSKGAVEDCVQRKIPKLIAEGKDKEQAVAIAYSMCEEAQKAEQDIEKLIEQYFTYLQKDQKNLENAIKNLENSISDLSGQDVDQVKAIIRSLTALVGRVYQKGGQTLANEDVKKEDTELKTETDTPSKEEVAKADSKEEAVKSETPSKEEVKKSTDEAKTITIDVGKLTEYITQLQDMAKTMTDKLEEVTKKAEEVSKAQEGIAKDKEEISKAESNMASAVQALTKVLEQIPLRKGEGPAKDETDRHKEIEKGILEAEATKNLKPYQQLNALIEKSAVKPSN